MVVAVMQGAGQQSRCSHGWTRGSKLLAVDKIFLLMEYADLSFCYLKIAGVCGWCLWMWILPGPLNPPVCESGVLICDMYLDGSYYILLLSFEEGCQSEWGRFLLLLRYWAPPWWTSLPGVSCVISSSSVHKVNQDSLHRGCHLEWATTLTFMRNTCRTFTFKGALSTSTKVLLMLYLTDLNFYSTSARYY